MNQLPLGVIEGFYGEPWSWQTRADTARFLAKAGYSFYLYAPKSDPFFRRRWREPFPRDLFAHLSELREVCKSTGIGFGVGFSPYEIYLSFDDTAKKQLEARIDTFNSLEIDHLAVLFDDMKGAPGLARTQAEIMHWIAKRSSAKKIVFCPTYYSLDPVLDRIFGERPGDYLQELGKSLDPEIGVFWTGEEICSKSYSTEHIRAVREALGRKPVLWDNYPVNDGPKMCKFLHLKPFTGRPKELNSELKEHVVNPMNQSLLSRIPMLTLAELYRSEEPYDPMSAWRRAVHALASADLGALLERDLLLFSETGLDGLSEEQKAQLLQEYGNIQEPMAHEVVTWLEGRTVVTREVFLNQ
ncbi:MAG: hypothetical protein A2X94_10090 [Bdellovibrionales bacterium GWB1_55_8]|nr:MAG: hypothetical protein A2X94_10090 [Bdellovibrionales bacterium GWB1_55_8]